MNDPYNPNALTERCLALRDRYFSLLDKTKNIVGFDKIMAFDEIVSELEAMAIEIEYICKM